MSSNNPTETQPITEKPSRFNKKLIYRLSFIIIFILAIIAYRFLFYYFTYSRDAYAYANVVNISSVVSGNIARVFVKDNQYVKANQPLIELDPAPFKYAVNKAGANLAAAKIAHSNAKDTIQQYTDAVKEKQTALATVQDHLRRYQALYKQNLISQITIVNTQAQVETARAALQSAEQEFNNIKRQFNQNAIDAAISELNTAEYNLQHSIIRAPAPGYVTNVYLRKGNYVHAGDDLFALVENDMWWVIARYRETVIRRIKPGDQVYVKFDMYPGKAFHGIVQSIGWGINRQQSSSDAAKSTLEYIKPTEDWIQIAQRFPVRVHITDLDPHYPLRIGATAYTYVHVDSIRK